MTTPGVPLPTPDLHALQSRVFSSRKRSAPRRPPPTDWPSASATTAPLSFAPDDDEGDGGGHSGANAWGSRSPVSSFLSASGPASGPASVSSTSSSSSVDLALFAALNSPGLGPSAVSKAPLPVGPPGVSDFIPPTPCKSPSVSRVFRTPANYLTPNPNILAENPSLSRSTLQGHMSSSSSSGPSSSTNASFTSLSAAATAALNRSNLNISSSNAMYSSMGPSASTQVSSASSSSVSFGVPNAAGSSPPKSLSRSTDDDICLTYPTSPDLPSHKPLGGHVSGPGGTDMDTSDLSVSLGSNNISSTLLTELINLGAIGSGSFSEVFRMVLGDDLDRLLQEEVAAHVGLDPAQVHGETATNTYRGLLDDVDLLRSITSRIVSRIPVYAIKKLKKRYNSDRARKMALQEVDNVVRLAQSNCPCIMTCFGAWEEAGYLFLQMEWCPSGSLQLFLDNAHEGPLPELEIWHIVRDLATGLKYIHDEGWLHLDIKPNNILLGLNSRWKIADFGLATPRNKWAPGLEGDSRYLAPEILSRNSRQTVGSALDMFSLGMTLVELAFDVELPKDGDLWRDLRSGSLPMHSWRVAGSEPGPNDFTGRGGGPQSVPCMRRSANLEALIQALLNPDPARRPTADDVLRMPEITGLANPPHSSFVNVLNVPSLKTQLESELIPKVVALVEQRLKPESQMWLLANMSQDEDTLLPSDGGAQSTNVSLDGSRLMLDEVPDRPKFVLPEDDSLADDDNESMDPTARRLALDDDDQDELSVSAVDGNMDADSMDTDLDLLGPIEGSGGQLHPKSLLDEFIDVS